MPRSCLAQAGLWGQPKGPKAVHAQLLGLPLTWAADRGLDARRLQHRDPVDGTFNVLAEYLPVQVEKAERKLVRHLRRQVGAAL